ncbi:unnamed protein product [Chrysoparadoxa australica]
MQRGFVDSATELAELMVEILSDNRMRATDERKAQLLRIDDWYSRIQSGTVELHGKGSEAGLARAAKLQVRFMKGAAKWAGKEGPYLCGDPGMHARLGIALFEIGEEDSGAKSLVVGEKPLELFELLWKSGQGATDKQTTSLRQVRLCRATLHFASIGNLRDANRFHAAYIAKLGEQGKSSGGGGKKGNKKSKSACGQPPLAVFCTQLLRACEYDAPPLFQKLAQTYQGELKADPSLTKYLHGIGKTYFKIQPPPSMMTQILQMMGGMPGTGVGGMQGMHSMLGL